MYVQGDRLGMESAVRVSSMNGRWREGVKMVVMNGHEHIRRRDQRWVSRKYGTEGKEEE